jgi:hypothetical protein
MKLKLVAFLLGVHFTSYTHALGLGELSVLSNLDQPLHATVELLGAPPAMEASCLSLRGSDNDLPVPAHAEFRIERRGDNALLHITTPRAINDPIAQFVLISDCEGRLQREYVLLLDPPTVGEPVRLAESQPAEPYAGARMPSYPISGPSQSAATSHAAQPPAATPPRASRTQARRTARAQSEMPTATSAANKPPVAIRAPDRVASPQARAETATPRLVISGKRDVSQSGNLPAGSEKGSSPSDQSTRSTNLTTTELSDENTALNHRLAHLESQIAALQKRNAELEAQRASPSLATAIAQPATQQASPWPLYMIGFGLFTLSGVLLAGMRRRRELAPGNETAALDWAQPFGSMPTKAPVDTRSPLPQPGARPQGDTPQPSTWRNAVEDQDFPRIPLATLAGGTEVKEDILNQAEVYVAHGYPNLAISLLQEHLHDVPAGSPVPWMLLLDLLLREGDEDGYVKASTECRRHFNVNFSVHPIPREQEGNRGLEAYPHILDMLSQAWNTPEIEMVFKDLIYDQRDGVRMGFEPEAYRDILLLRGIAQEKTLQYAV